LALFFIGVVVQAAGLATFVYAARSEFPDVGKPMTYLATGIAVAALQWSVVRRSKATAELALTPMLLAVGFALSYLALGGLRFRLLLNGLDWSSDSIHGIVGSTVWVMLLYGALMSALLLARLGWKKWGEPTGANRGIEKSPGAEHTGA
jgi:hypothetical protein